MQAILKKIIHRSLSVFIAISVLTLNLSGLLQCSTFMMADDCCHIVKIVKPCCAKNLKITFEERVSGHCGCTIQESSQSADLYNDIKNSNSNLTSRAVQYNSAIESGFHPVFTGNITPAYSPPVKNFKDSYLTNLSLRI
jgi:hypothetical protein